MKNQFRKLPLVPFAFYTGATPRMTAISTAATYSRKFWRIYRVGPGLTRSAILGLVASQAANAAKMPKVKLAPENLEALKR